MFHDSFLEEIGDVRLVAADAREIFANDAVKPVVECRHEQARNAGPVFHYRAGKGFVVINVGDLVVLCQTIGFASRNLIMAAGSLAIRRVTGINGNSHVFWPIALGIHQTNERQAVNHSHEWGECNLQKG